MRGLWLLLLVLALVRTASAETLTLPQTLAMAHDQSSTLKVAKEQEQEAFFAWRQAVALPPMTLSETGQMGTVANATFNGAGSDIYSVVTQSYGPWGSIHWAATSALAAYRAAQANTHEVQNTLDQNVKDAFWGLLSAQDQVTIAQENLDMAQRIYLLTDQRFKLGEGPRMDVVNALIQLATSEQTMVTQQATLRQAEATLNGALELPIRQSTRAEGTMEGVPSLAQTLDPLLQLAESSRGVVLAARLAVQEAEAQVQLTRTERYPTLSAAAAYDQAPNPNVNNNVQNTTYVNVTVQLPIVDWGTIRNQVYQNEHTVSEKQHTLDSTLVTVDTGVRTAYETYQGAYGNAKVYRSHVLEPSEELLRMTEAGFRQGLVSYLQVVNAEQTLRQARLQYAQLLLLARQSMDALEAAVGTSLSG